MIVRTIFRALWVVVAFTVAAGAALAVLVALGAMWAGDELRAAAPHDPMIEMGAPWFGAALFTITVAPALSALPGLVAIVTGEVLRIRNALYYLLAGGTALLAVPLLAGAPSAAASLPSSQVMTIFATAGFAGGFCYWLLAGRRA